MLLYVLVSPASETVKYRASVSQTPSTLVPKTTGGRRTVLPAHCPDNSHVGLMAILYNNIGGQHSAQPAALICQRRVWDGLIRPWTGCRFCYTLLSKGLQRLVVVVRVVRVFRG